MQEYHAYFFTATIKEWKHLLKPDKYKEIIVDSLRFLVAEKRVRVYGFVIMPNHIHLIWQVLDGHRYLFAYQGVATLIQSKQKFKQGGSIEYRNDSR